MEALFERMCIESHGKIVDEDDTFDKIMKGAVLNAVTGDDKEALLDIRATDKATFVTLTMMMEMRRL